MGYSWCQYSNRLTKTSTRVPAAVAILLAVLAFGVFIVGFDHGAKRLDLLYHLAEMALIREQIGPMSLP